MIPYNNQEPKPTPEELKKLTMCILLYIIIMILSNIFAKYGLN